MLGPDEKTMLDANFSKKDTFGINYMPDQIIPPLNLVPMELKPLGFHLPQDNTVDIINH